MSEALERGRTASFECGQPGAWPVCRGSTERTRYGSAIDGDACDISAMEELADEEQQARMESADCGGYCSPYSNCRCQLMLEDDDVAWELKPTGDTAPGMPRRIHPRGAMSFLEEDWPRASPVPD